MSVIMKPPKEPLPEGTASSPFFNLFPQEIRDEIYLLAYPPNDDTFAIASLPRLEKKEKQRRSQIGGHRWFSSRHFCAFCEHINRRPEPTCPLNAMMVCKQFYHEAAELWLRRTRFRVTDARDFHKILATAAPLLQENIRALEIASVDERRSRGHSVWSCLAARMQNLRDFSLDIDDGLLEEENLARLRPVLELARGKVCHNADGEIAQRLQGAVPDGELDERMMRKCKEEFKHGAKMRRVRRCGRCLRMVAKKAGMGMLKGVCGFLVSVSENIEEGEETKKSRKQKKRVRSEEEMMASLNLAGGFGDVGGYHGCHC